MTTLLKKSRTIAGAGSNFSPVGYFRLGVSAPRDRARGYYPMLRRVLSIPDSVPGNEATGARHVFHGREFGRVFTSRGGRVFHGRQSGRVFTAGGP